jgi:hypothetical protein
MEVMVSLTILRRLLVWRGSGSSGGLLAGLLCFVCFGFFVYGW